MLNEGEEIVLDRHPHWSFLLGAMTMIAMAVVAAIAIAVVSMAWAWVGLIIIALALLGSVGRYLRWRTTEFVLTTDRLIVRQGILAKQGIEIPLDRVTNISYRQALWERVLGCGDLVVESAGESGHQFFTDVANPSHVQNLIYKTAEESISGRFVDEAGDPVARPSHHLSIPEQIEKLAQLRDRGIVSDEEFDQKKRDLLDRM